QRCLTFRNAVAWFSGLKKGQTQIVMSRSVVRIQPQRFVKMIDRLRNSAKPRQRHSKIFLNVRVVRRQLSCVANFIERGFAVALHRQRHAQQVVRFRRVRSQTECRLTILNSFWQPVLVKTGNAHVQQRVVQQRVVVSGNDLQGLLKMRPGFVVQTTPAQGRTQIVFYNEIRWSDRERVLKQGEAVTPAMNLSIRKDSKSQ